MGIMDFMAMVKADEAADTAKRIEEKLDEGRPSRTMEEYERLEEIEKRATAIANDYGQNPSEDRRQVRRLAAMVAELAHQMKK